jgi:hypothetical protein
VVTIEAGFEEEKRFTLPVQDAVLSGKIKYSSIHPNQSYTEKWEENGDSIYWKLNIDKSGTFKVEMQYACIAEETGSKMAFSSNAGTINFIIDKPFRSEILPERDYVIRSESVERTWSWMTLGDVKLHSGEETIILRLINVANTEAALIRAIRFTKK